jgi:hypothetical protein
MGFVIGKWVIESGCEIFDEGDWRLEEEIGCVY